MLPIKLAERVSTCDRTIVSHATLVIEAHFSIKRCYLAWAIINAFPKHVTRVRSLQTCVWLDWTTQLARKYFSSKCSISDSCFLSIFTFQTDRYLNKMKTVNLSKTKGGGDRYAYFNCVVSFKHKYCQRTGDDTNEHLQQSPSFPRKIFILFHFNKIIIE